MLFLNNRYSLDVPTGHILIFILIREEVLTLQYYETILLLSPELGESDLEAQINGAKETLTNSGAEIVNELSWGKKKLAYMIGNFSSAYFHIIRSKSSTNLVPELETRIRITEDLLRQMTVKISENELERNFEF